MTDDLASDEARGYDFDAPGYDFGRLCRVFRTWYDQQGLSQSRLEEAGGPSGPVITKLYNGSWMSNRPRAITEKVDRGFGWPKGTAWNVLCRMDKAATASESEESRLRIAVRVASTFVGSPHDQAAHRADLDAAVADLDNFLSRQALVVVDQIRLSVGGDVKTDRSYVEAPGDRVEGGEHGDATARAIDAMRAELREMAHRQLELAEEVRRLQTRLGSDGSDPEPVDGAGSQT